MYHVEWYHVCWPRLTAKRVEPVVSISWASCSSSFSELPVTGRNWYRFLEQEKIWWFGMCSVTTTEIHAIRAIIFGFQHTKGQTRTCMIFFRGHWMLLYHFVNVLWLWVRLKNKKLSYRWQTCATRLYYRLVKVTKDSSIPYVRYSFLLCNCNFVFTIFHFKNVVTLKTGSEVTHGHWKWHKSIDCVWFPISVL